MADFFISYTQADRPWAEWIARTLEEAKHSVKVQAWDFRPGGNFVVEMQRAALGSNRTIAVLSPDYLRSLFAMSEWAAAFAADPDGTHGKLVPIQVRAVPTENLGLLAAIIHIDLVGLGEAAAREAIVKGLTPGRIHPESVRFPGSHFFPGSTRTPPDPLDVETTLAALPVEEVPIPGPLPEGSRMLLAPNPLFVGREEDPAGSAGRGGFDLAASAGMFVGVSTFEDERIVEVPYAVDDAVDLAHLFALELGVVTPERAVLLIAGEPRKAESVARLEALRQSGARFATARQRDIYRHLTELVASVRSGGMALLSVATHGVSDAGGDFLVATDSLADRKLRTGVSVSEVFEEASRAGRGLVLLDACREQVLRARSVGTGAAMGKGFAEAIARARGLVVLSGATLGGFAYDDPKRRNGVFTAAVLDGLHGGAAPGPGGWITVGTLAQFVQEQVVAWVRREWPGHAERSLGIGKRIESSAEGLPLAPHPSATRERERYRERRTKALARVREFQGELLSGAHWDQVRALLPPQEPNAEADKLLEEIEALDGGVRSQRGLRDYLREMAGEEAVVSPPPKAAALRPAESPPRPAQRVVSPPPMGPSEPVPERPRAAAERVKLRWGKPGSRAAIAAGGMLVAIIVLWLVVRVMELPAPAAMPVKQPQVDSGSTTRESVPVDPVASSRRTNSLGMNFLYVPSGTYTIGSPKGEAGRIDELELLPYDVTLTRGFWLGETEVTQAQWAQLVPDEKPWRFKSCGADCPVENVSWYAAAEFANRLSKAEKLTPCYDLNECKGTLGGDYTCQHPPPPDLNCPGYRLPTESEWEVAARAGKREPQATYAGNLTLRGAHHAPELDAIAWYGGNSGATYADAFDCSEWPDKQYSSTRCGPSSVGGKKSNPWGFHDMLGNVYEWTGDWYTTKPTGQAVYPRGPDKGSNRVFRGGSWHSDAQRIRAAYRDRRDPSDRWDALGFRFARGQGLRSSTSR